MNVAIFGAGYVGCITAACLAASGHRVWLVEVHPEKLALLRRGQCPVFEPKLDSALREGWRSRRILPVVSGAEAVPHTEVALVCVGTPSQRDGSPDVTQLRQVLCEIAETLVMCPQPYVIALRSTVPYPQVREELLPIVQDRLPDRFGTDVTFAVNPEFLREGQALEDFQHPPFVIVGTDHPVAAQKLAELYRPLAAPYLVVAPGTASLLKYACNAFHAVKVAFANEIASLETAFGADANAVMETFCLDRSLNLSAAYLRPGFAFGGACLPKDLQALNRVAAVAGVPCSLLGAVLGSNEVIIERAIDTVIRLGGRDITLVGLSFKADTDDMRNSPLVELAERLLGKGYHVRLYDPDVQPAALYGQNRRYIEQRLEHLASLLCPTAEAALHGTQLVIVGKMLLSETQLQTLCPAQTWVLDLTRQLPTHLPPLRLLRFNSAAAAASAAPYGR
jgi:GDP-mannose 6-dehydrogenase